MEKANNDLPNAYENDVNKHYLITTIDNPYSPFDEFDDWWRYDRIHNYGTIEKLSRLSPNSDLFTDEENADETDKAVDRLMAIDILGIYKKAFKNDNYHKTAVSNPYLESLNA